MSLKSIINNIKRYAKIVMMRWPLILIMIILCSGAIYMIVDKETYYVSQYRFFYESINTSEIVAQMTKTLLQKRRGIDQSILRRIQARRSDRLRKKAANKMIAITTSQTAIYEILLDSITYDNHTDLMAHNMIDLYMPDRVSKLSGDSLSIKDFRTLRRLHRTLYNKKGTGWISLKYDLDSRVFILRTKTPDRQFTENLIKMMYDKIVFTNEVEERAAIINKLTNTQKDLSKLDTSIQQINMTWAIERDRTRAFTSQISRLQLKQMVEKRRSTFEDRREKEDTYYLLKELLKLYKHSKFELIDHSFEPVIIAPEVFRKILSAVLISLICSILFIIASYAIKEIMTD
ncbi:MAG: hypothetical protein ACJA01_003148 [Saprospiraceae bacterium]|jgi:hypothetical protein